MYIDAVKELARGAIAAHGRLKEVIFVEPSRNSLLVFFDGTIVPVDHGPAGYDISKEKYAVALAQQLGGTNPFSLLTFGNKGMHACPKCYAVFLSEAGFKHTYVANIEGPIILKPYGSMVRGTRRSGQWTVEVSAPSVQEAKRKIEEPPFPHLGILSEDILNEGPPTRIRVSYGPKKLKCTKCGEIMIKQRPVDDYEGLDIIKLHCKRCNITLIENRREIGAEWIQWEDGSKTAL